MKLVDSYYKCPRCQCIVCQLPLLCPICGLMLADYTNFTRAYHHLNPLVNFQDAKIEKEMSLCVCLLRRSRCFGCYQELKPGDVCMQCPKCGNVFCEICDAYLHDDIYHCPGCLI